MGSTKHAGRWKVLLLITLWSVFALEPEAKDSSLSNDFSRRQLSQVYTGVQQVECGNLGRLVDYMFQHFFDRPSPCRQSEPPTSPSPTPSPPVPTPSPPVVASSNGDSGYDNLPDGSPAPPLGSPPATGKPNPDSTAPQAPATPTPQRGIPILSPSPANSPPNVPTPAPASFAPTPAVTVAPATPAPTQPPTPAPSPQPTPSQPPPTVDPSRVDSVRNCKQGVRQRKEYRELSSAEWDSFKAAVMRLLKVPSQRGHNSLYEEFCHDHFNYREDSHSGSQFLPWHRLFLARFESALQSVDPNVVLPYWDWTKDLPDPLNIPLLKDDKYLHLGNDCPIKVNSPYASFGPNHCVFREPGTRNTTWYAPWRIDSLIKTERRFWKFSEVVELTIHNVAHVQVGGDMYYKSSSACDPLFFLHHAQVDRLWYLWQAREGNMNSYDGEHFHGTEKQMTVAPSDILMPFDVSVASSLDTAKLCYTYGSPSSSVSFSLVAEHTEQEDTFQGIDEDWVKEMGMSIEKVREAEAFMLALTPPKLENNKASSGSRASRSVEGITCLVALLSWLLTWGTLSA